MPYKHHFKQRIKVIIYRTTCTINYEYDFLFFEAGASACRQIATYTKRGRASGFVWNAVLLVQFVVKVQSTCDISFLIYVQYKHSLEGFLRVQMFTSWLWFHCTKLWMLYGVQWYKQDKWLTWVKFLDTISNEKSVYPRWYSPTKHKCKYMYITVVLNQ